MARGTKKRKKHKMSSKLTQLQNDCRGKTFVKPFDIRTIKILDDKWFVYLPNKDSYVELIDITFQKIGEGSFGKITRGTSKMYPEIDFVIKENKDDSTILDEIRLLNDLPMYITCRDYLIRFKKLGEKHVIMPHVTGDLNKLKNLNVNQIKSIIQILGQGLLCLAKQNIFYFDIKAENIFYNCIDNNTMSVFFGDLGSMLSDTDGDYVATFPPPKGLVKNMDELDKVAYDILDIRNQTYTPRKGAIHDKLMNKLMGLKAERGFISIKDAMTQYDKIYSWQLSVLALQLLNFKLLGEFTWVDFTSIEELQKAIKFGIFHNFGVREDLEFLKQTLILEPEYRMPLSELLIVLKTNTFL